MIDENDFIVTHENNNKTRILYRCSCVECNVDMGYKRKTNHKRKGLCRICSHRFSKKPTLQEIEANQNVDFNDVKYVSFNKIKSSGSGLKTLYRCQCKFCGIDKGHVNKKLFTARCYKCAMTDERKKQISATCQKIDIENWVGNTAPKNTLIRQSKLGREWRQLIFEKYNYTCDISGKKGGKLQAHHLRSFDLNIESRFDIDNGICLSKEMHIEFHKAYGRGNNTKEQYEEFKRAKQKELGLIN